MRYDQCRIRYEEYRVSKRVVLRAGDKFRASRGPYYEGESGRVSMAERGVFTFLGYVELGDKCWIEAYSQNGFCALNVGNQYRSKGLSSLVNRPYRIRRVKR